METTTPKFGVQALWLTERHRCFCSILYLLVKLSWSSSGNSLLPKPFLAWHPSPRTLFLHQHIVPVVRVLEFDAGLWTCQKAPGCRPGVVFCLYCIHITDRSALSSFPALPSCKPLTCLPHLGHQFLGLGPLAFCYVPTGRWYHHYKGALVPP